MSTFAQIPITGGLYNSVAQRLPLVTTAALLSNMSDGAHHIGVTNAGYYRVAANVQITGVTGTQAVFYIQQVSGAVTTVVNQYFLDISGNMVVSFENVVHASSGDTFSIYLTVSANGAVLINPSNAVTYPSALFAYLVA